MTVNKPQHLLVVLHGADETLISGDSAAEKRNYFRLQTPPIRLRQRLILLSAEGLLTFVMRFDVSRCTVDDLEGCFVTGLVVVVPRAHAMVTKQNPFGLWMIFNQLLDFQTNIESRPLPRDVNYFAAVNVPG